MIPTDLDRDIQAAAWKLAETPTAAQEAFYGAHVIALSGIAKCWASPKATPAQKRRALLAAAAAMIEQTTRQVPQDTEARMLAFAAIVEAAATLLPEAEPEPESEREQPTTPEKGTEP
jgi:hypothetical protein